MESNKMANSNEILEKIRQAFADYRKSEGCSCCQNIKEHEKSEKELAELLSADTYEDGSGYNWRIYESKS